jgi:hypothetical protein
MFLIFLVFFKFFGGFESAERGMKQNCKTEKKHQINTKKTPKNNEKQASWGARTARTSFLGRPCASAGHGACMNGNNVGCTCPHACMRGLWV